MEKREGPSRVEHADANAAHSAGTGARLSRAMLAIVLTSVLLLLGVGLIPTSWATPAQTGLNQTVPTRTPVPLTMTLAITLQRPNSPPPSAPWAVPMRLSFYPPGDAATVLGQWDVTLDQRGQWTGGVNLAPGTYDVRAKNPHTLRNVKRNVAVAPQTTVAMGTLREGDADNDNRVRASDFAILRATYFKNVGDVGFDARADFDVDQRVRSSDFALLRSNYFASGDIEVTTTLAAAASVPQDLVNLALEPAAVAVEPGDIFTLTLMAHAGAQAFVAMDTIIRFPAANLQVVGPDGLPTTQIESLSLLDDLINQVDNTQGRILYGVGSFTHTVSGNVPLARLRLKAVSPASRMRIDLVDATVSDDTGMYVTGSLSGAVATYGTPINLVFLPIVFK